MNKKVKLKNKNNYKSCNLIASKNKDSHRYKVIIIYILYKLDKEHC